MYDEVIKQCNFKANLCWLGFLTIIIGAIFLGLLLMDVSSFIKGNPHNLTAEQIEQIKKIRRRGWRNYIISSLISIPLSIVGGAMVESCMASM